MPLTGAEQCIIFEHLSHLSSGGTLVLGYGPPLFPYIAHEGSSIFFTAIHEIDVN